VTVTDAGPVTKKQPIWQRHRRLAIAAAVLVIALITVLTDLPTSTSRATDLAAERSVMSEVNSDLQPCAYAVGQAVGIWALEVHHELTASERAPTPGLLSDDQSACSLTNQGLYDLSNVQTPGTPAGKELGQLLAIAMLWTTSDSLRAIEDVQTLMNHPNDAAAVRDLSREDGVLASDRRTALAEESAADRDLHTQLQPVDLPPVPATATSSTTATAS
jgi:hypothetical protein